MTLNNKTYNILKWITMIFLPAVGAFYFAIAQIWDLPGSLGVNGTINALVTFLGLLIGHSTAQYNKTAGAPDGDLIVSADPVSGETYLGLGVNNSVEEMTNKDQVKLNVVDKTGEIPPAPPVNPGTSTIA